MSAKKQTVEIIIPVYNEQGCLRENVVYLRDYLEGEKSYGWKINIVDNASTDGTPEIGRRFALEDEKVIYTRISRKGRGYALREVFLASESDIVCYMDADLSTDLACLKPLINGVIGGFDLAVGSRLMRGAKTTRRPVREFFSRGYNLLIKIMFRNHFSDAQCGFKAIRTEMARKLVPMVKNNNWFFDTELMILAEMGGYKICEIPVKWTENYDSKVSIVPTISEFVLGLCRLRTNIRKLKNVKQRSVYF